LFSQTYSLTHLFTDIKAERCPFSPLTCDLNHKSQIPNHKSPPATFPMLLSLRIWIVIGLTLATVVPVRADTPVAIHLEVVLEPDAPITAPQEWAQRLGQLGLSRLQIHSANGPEKPRAAFNDQHTRIDVLAVLTRRNELVLPLRRFRASEIAALREYFEQLPQSLAEEGVERGLFNLTEPQFAELLSDLGRPVGLATKGKTAAEVLTHCDRQFRIPIRRNAQALPLLRTGKPLAMELQDLSGGTMLAIVLRRDGLTFVPRVDASGKLELLVSAYQQGQESWPPGWKPQGSPRQVAPKLYESLSVEIEGFTLASALTALAPRLALPVVMDERILGQLGIQPGTIKVKLPRKKTTLKSTVDRLCSQARLATEVRVDERDTPFLWITQFGPDSEPSRGE
jgi:hypothetical protein